MKLLLLKTLLRRQAKDDGYVLPIVIAIGLVMVLLGAVNLTGANEENLNAITQNSRSDALGIAEVGIAKYREMLDKNRILTVYNRDQWTSNNLNGVDVAAQTCDNITDTLNGWANNDYDGLATVPDFEPPTGTKGKDYWRAVTLDETVVSTDLNGDGDATDNSVDIGWFKIVDYEYDNDMTLGDGDDGGIFSVVSDANTDDDDPTQANFGTLTVANRDENDFDDDGRSDARGILTVKGRTSDGSEAQIEVEIPIRVNDLNNFAPVLWIGDSAIPTPGTLNIPNPNANANIVLTTNAGAGCTSPGAIAGNTNVLNDPRGIPPIISDPAGVAASPGVLAIPAILDANKNILNNLNTSIGGANLLLPRPLATQDNKTIDDRFLYDIDNLTVTQNNLQIDGVAKVSLYVRDSFSITNTGGTLSIGNFNAATSNVSSHNLEIYCGNDVNTIDINTGSAGDTINIEALIHAPNAVLKVTGSGNLNVNGALWVKNINNGANATVTIRGDQTDTTTGSEPSYKFYTTSANRTPRPLTGSPTNWKTEEVN